MNEDELVHYFAGECSEEEESEIEAWIHADPERERRVAKLRRIWEAAAEPAQDQSSADGMWDDLTQRFESSELGIKRGGDDSAQRAKRDRRGRDRMLVTFAAAVVMSIVAVWAFYDGSLMGQNGAKMRRITTEVGEQAQIRFGDGTQITLNAESRLAIPHGFADGKRTVNLQGQAYFEVESNPDRPFVVRAGGSVAKVLGTKFDVGAYPSDDTVRVVVAEGKVAMRSAREKPEANITLTEKQMGSMAKSGLSVMQQSVDPAPYLAWTEGQLVFRNASFGEVARRLKNWYGLHVTLDGSPGAVDHLNTSFTDEPVSEVLHIIAETLDLSYERKGDTVTFFVRE